MDHAHWTITERSCSMNYSVTTYSLLEISGIAAFNGLDADLRTGNDPLKTQLHSIHNINSSKSVSAAAKILVNDKYEIPNVKWCLRLIELVSTTKYLKTIRIFPMLFKDLLNFVWRFLTTVLWDWSGRWDAVFSRCSILYTFTIAKQCFWMNYCNKY